METKNYEVIYEDVSNRQLEEQDARERDNLKYNEIDSFYDYWGL